MPTEVKQWRAEDSTLFDTREAAEEHEAITVLVTRIYRLGDGAYGQLPESGLYDALRDLRRAGWQFIAPPLDSLRTSLKSRESLLT